MALAADGAAGAEGSPYAEVIKGTEGTRPLELAVDNQTGAPLDCTASLAHWYSEDLGTADPGHVLTIRLRHAPQTGVLSMMNATDDRMPVEAIDCATGDARTRLSLPTRTGDLAARQTHVCRADAGTIACKVAQ